MRRLLLVAVMAVASFGAVHVGVAHAIAPCGTISSSATLGSDCTAPLTVGASGIAINLGGHKVSCSGGGTGIDVGSQSNVVVQNGSVSGCDPGLNADGGNFNLFQLLTMRDDVDGIEVANSDSSTIQRNSITTNSMFSGLNLFQTSNTLVQRNTISNTGLGIVENGGTNNAILRNSASDGFVSGLVSVGILFAGMTQSDVVSRNTTTGNGVGIWVNDLSSGNRLVTNTSMQNTQFDLQDDSPSCDSNVWKANNFLTANQPCIH